MIRATWSALTGAGLCLAGCGPRPVAPFCGNQICEPGEDSTTCVADCPPGTVCGNTICEPFETGTGCPQDCPITCGNSVCDASETPAVCPTDCQAAPMCGDGMCNGTEDSTTCPVDCVPTTDADFRATALSVVTPASLGIVNGAISSSIASMELNLLERATGLGGPVPGLEIGAGVPAASPGSYTLGTSTTFGASFDTGTRLLSTTTLGTVTITVPVDYDGDGAPDLFIPLAVHGVAGPPMMDLPLDATFSSFSGGVLRGVLLVDELCQLNIDFGTGTPLNLLDVVDGSGANTLPPDLTLPCAPGGGSGNVLPDADVDGNGSADAYRTEWSLDGAAVTIVN